MNGSSEAFLDGQGIAVDLGSVEEELDRLWGPAAELAGGPDVDQPSVTRVVLANIVVLALREEADRVGRVVEAITAEYPSRTLVIRPGDQRRAIQAELAAVCHLPTAGRAQVCSERIALRAGPDALDLVPAAVRSLSLSDLHHVVWCLDDPGEVRGLLTQLAADATRVILDRPDPDDGDLGAAFDVTADPLPRDLAWYAITSWRELIAPLFDGATASPERRDVESIEIHAETREGGHVPRLAIWLAAWLAGQLGWSPASIESRGPGLLAARFDSPLGPVRCSIRVSAGGGGPARIVGVRWAVRGARPDEPPGIFTLTRIGPDEAAVLVEVHCASHCELPRSVVSPAGQRDRWIAAALQADRVDPPYRRAVPIARWLLAGS